MVHEDVLGGPAAAASCARTQREAQTEVAQHLPLVSCEGSAAVVIDGETGDPLTSMGSGAEVAKPF